jgi:hypothetical protein
MTIFAVICAATYVVSHMGRPWLAYWVLPLPNQFGSLWVNFNSPLVWDMFAISTYFSVSLLFWYTGLLPDIATIRDSAEGMRKKIYTILSFGWAGNVKTWQRFEAVSLILAGISTPLGTFGTHDCIDGLCNVGNSGMAHHDFPSILCCWSDFLRICDGINLIIGCT